MIKKNYHLNGIFFGHYYDSDDRTAKIKNKRLYENVDVYEIIGEDFFGVDSISNGYSSILDMYSDGYKLLKKKKLRKIMI